MDRVKNFVCHVIGWNNSGTASNKRKRSSEDTDNLVHDKNSLNSPLPTVKRARFDKGDYQTAANATDDSYQEEKTFWSRIFDTFRPYIGNMMTPKPIRQRVPDNDQQEDTNLTNNIETIDLVSSGKYLNNLKCYTQCFYYGLYLRKKPVYRLICQNWPVFDLYFYKMSVFPQK